MKSVHITEAKFLQLEVNTTTLSKSTWLQVSTAKVSATTFRPSSWQNDVSTHHWGQISAARGQYYYMESQYLRPSFYCKMLVLLPWDPVADKMMSVHINEAKFLLLEVSTTTLSPSGWHIDVSSHP